MIQGLGLAVIVNLTTTHVSTYGGWKDSVMQPFSDTGGGIRSDAHLNLIDYSARFFVMKSNNPQESRHL